MISELSAILISILSSSVVGTLIGTLLYWRYNKRLKELEVEKARVETKADEWHLYKEQLEYSMKINAEKDRCLIEKEEHYEKRIGEIEARFNKQTEYLRGIQRAHKDALEEVNRLTARIGLMQRIIDHLKQWLCKRTYKECTRREPEQIIKPTRYVPLHDMDADVDIDELLEEIVPEASIRCGGCKAEQSEPAGDNSQQTYGNTEER